MRFIPEYPPSTGDPALSEWIYRELNRLGAELEAELVSEEFLIEVQKGNVSGHSLVHKFGRNDAVPNGSWAFVNSLGFTSWPLSAATTVRVKAGNTNDTVAGSGARKVYVQGIDDSGDEVSEEIELAGTSASSATSTSFFRVHRAWVSAVGTYGGANTGDVVIENSAGGTDLLKIMAGEGQSQFAAWSVPAGKMAYLMSIHLTVDSNKKANIRVFMRKSNTDATGDMEPKRLKLYFDGVTGDFIYSPRSPGMVIPAETDIWIEAYGDGGTCEVSADFELLVTT